MAFEFAAAKRLLRRAVHTTFGIDATYEDPHLAAPAPLRIRWHNKLAVYGDIENTGYPSTIESIDKVVFDRDDLLARGIEIRRGGIIKIIADGFEGQSLIADTRDPRCGPIEEIWMVGKQSDGGLDS